MHVRLRSRVLVLAFALAAGSTPLAGQLDPPSNGGMVALDRVLQQLGERRRVLVIGAHPDDEDTALLSLLARGYGARVAYLALCRGEGGQNLIGPELGRGLGLIRSRELLAARALDGAEQFFTRAYDFGYTRSLEETSGRWPPDSILKDVVRVIRRFRPHVIVSVFSGTPRDGHGQHQAAGVAAAAAFEAAGDPSRFPELEIEEGLTPWEPLKFYRSARFNRSATTLSLPTGMLDPRLGKSYHQIAMASRSRHRSQDMGVLQPIGPQQTRLQLVTDRTGGAVNGSDDLFAGVLLDPTPLTRVARTARAGVDPTNLAALAPELVTYLPEASGRSRDLLHRAIGIAAGVVVDAVAADDEVVAGQTVPVTVSLFNGGPFDIGVNDVTIAAPEGWVVARDSLPSGPVRSGTLASVGFRVAVAPSAPPTQPYFLERPMVGSMYDWSDAPPAVRGLPFQAPLLDARIDLTVLGGSLELHREVTHRERNQAAGEVRREVRVVPLVDVKVDPGNLVWPVPGRAARDFTVSLVYNGAAPYTGEARLAVAGWPTPAPRAFAFPRAGDEARFTFTVTRPATVTDARVEIRAVALGEDGQVFDRGVEVVAYPHIRPTAMARPAVSEVLVAPMTLPPLTRVGYVRGASDRVPEALSQIGVPVEMLDAARLAAGDLTVYDAIVVGSRAYEADSALIEHNARLLEYARAGGLLIVQYQQYQFVQGGFAPFPLTINRPHDRVTDETAPVRVLRPEHPVFNVPNRIGPADWDDWPQERGLYFAGTWDAAYEPLLEMHDPGLPPLQGGLLVAPYGTGTYVYTGLSFFRSLPAGTPGAFRLFLNLLGLQPKDVL